MDNIKIARKIIDHPDKPEILVKLLSNIPNEDIVEWLDAKYSSVGERQFVLSNKEIIVFKKNYLDFYTIIKEDAEKTKIKLSPDEELKLEIQGTPAYHRSLEQYVNSEVDIKMIVKRMVAAIEMRASQVFDQIQEDPRNVRMDRTLTDWFNTLIGILEKYDTILNGNPEQINIQNNINIQIVDQHINLVYDAIKEVLEKLDYDSSLLIENFSEKMNQLKLVQNNILPQEVRVQEINKISNLVLKKIQ